MCDGALEFSKFCAGIMEKFSVDTQQIYLQKFEFVYKGNWHCNIVYVFLLSPSSYNGTDDNNLALVIVLRSELSNSVRTLVEVILTGIFRSPTPSL